MSFTSFSLLQLRYDGVWDTPPATRASPSLATSRARSQAASLIWAPWRTAHTGVTPTPRGDNERFVPTYSVGEFVASVLQLVVAGVEGEGLHDVGPRPQELPVQLAHFKSKRSRRENSRKSREPPLKGPSYLLRDVPLWLLGSRDRPSRSLSSPEQTRTLHRRSQPRLRWDAPKFPVKMNKWLTVGDE